jgi:hypothetical protein
MICSVNSRSFDILGRLTFSKIQLTFGAKENLPKSTTRTWYDHYEFLAMPFRLTYTPWIFMNLMSQMLHEYLDR